MENVPQRTIGRHNLVRKLERISYRNSDRCFLAFINGDCVKVDLLARRDGRRESAVIPAAQRHDDLSIPRTKPIDHHRDLFIDVVSNLLL